MSLIKITNTAMELEIVSTTPTDLVAGTITIVTAPSLVCKAGGLAIYKGDIELLIQNVTAPGAGATIVDPASVVGLSGTIKPTAEFVKSEGDFVLRENDETDTINTTPKIPGSPNPVDYPTSFKVRVKTAGQDNAKGA